MHSRLSCLIVSPIWGKKYGGTLNARTLSRVLYENGYDVTVVTGRDADEKQAHEKIEQLDSLFRSRIVPHMLALFRVIALAREHQRIFIFGDAPRVAYIIAQLFSTVYFIRTDTILTCPANNRFLPRTKEVCYRAAGFGCLKVSKKTDCLEHLTVTKKLGRIVLRLRDMALLKLFRFFITDSDASLRRHLRSGQFIHEPCSVSDVGSTQNRCNDVAFVGRLVDYKGCLDALKVFSLSSNAEKLHVIGDGPQRVEMEEYAKSVGLQKDVIFHGWLDMSERDRVLSSVKATLVCSLWDEAFCRVGPESFALGTPVIAYDSGGISEWCQKPAGVLVTTGNVSAAAESVDSLISDEASWLRASSSAVVQAASFSEEAFKQRWLDVIG